MGRERMGEGEERTDCAHCLGHCSGEIRWGKGRWKKRNNLPQLAGYLRNRILGRRQKVVIGLENERRRR